MVYVVWGFLNFIRVFFGVEKYLLEFFIISRGFYSLNVYLCLKYLI